VAVYDSFSILRPSRKAYGDISWTCRRVDGSRGKAERRQSRGHDILALGQGMREGYTEESHDDYEPNFRREECTP
jgi:hypothetical protein